MTATLYKLRQQQHEIDWHRYEVPAALLLGLVLYAFFALTTPRIPGYGADGESYASMAKAFDPTKLGHLPSIVAPHNTRYLPSIIAHYINPDPVLAFMVLNAISILGLILAYRAILRFYGLEMGWIMLAIILYLTTWPGLRFWIYYPVLTDQLGNALLLATAWAILTKRYLLYALAAAALMSTRENGAVLLVFFVLFHINPWNPYREKTGYLYNRAARLAAWSLFPLLVLLQVRLFPVFPQSNNYNMVGTALFAIKATLGSGEKQTQFILAVLNIVGVLPYALWWGISYFGLSRIAAVLRANLHWLWYVASAVVFAPLSWTDEERFLLLAVPVLALAAVQCLRKLPAGRATWFGLVGFAVIHAYLVNAFAPLDNRSSYLRLWGAFMSSTDADRLVTFHVVLTAVTVVIFVTVAMHLALRRSTSG